MLFRSPGHIVVEILPAIMPGLHRKDFMAQLESQMEAHTRQLLEENPAR